MSSLGAEARPGDPPPEIWFDPRYRNDFDLVELDFGDRKGLVHETNSLALNIMAVKAIQEGRPPANLGEAAYMARISQDPVMRMSIVAVLDQETPAVQAVEAILTLDARENSQFMYQPSEEAASNPYINGQEDVLRKYHMSRIYEEFASVARSFDAYYDLTNFAR